MDDSDSSTITNMEKKNVLDAGTVEARGFGGDKDQSRDEIEDEIEEFLIESTTSINVRIKTELRCFFSILLFVTTLNCPPSWAKIHPGYLMKGMCYFPVVGFIVGSVVALFFDVGWLVLELPVIISAVFSTTMSLKLTGCLHEDGLADSADGFGGGWTRSQILRIMSDSRLGTFGSAALMMYIVTKLELLASLDQSNWKFYTYHDFNFYCDADDHHAHIDGEMTRCGGGGGSHGAGPALVVGHTLARLTAPYLIWRCNYIEEDGPKSNFYSLMIRAKFLCSSSRLLCSLFFCYGVSTMLYGPYLSLLLVIVTCVCAECAGHYGRNKLGGVMGDYLGATICITELMIYVALAGGKSWKDRIAMVLHGSNSSSSQEKGWWKILLMEEDKDKVHLLTRFILIVIVYQIWCWFVQVQVQSSIETETAMDVDTDTNKSKSKSTDDKNLAEDSSSSSQHLNLLSPQKKAAQDVLTSSTSSFRDKHNAAQDYIDCLAKPVGSLGTLEEWAARICALQGSIQPKADPVCAIIFAGDHGVAKQTEEGGEGCSAFPQAVTKAIIRGLQTKVAGASVLAQELGVDLSVVDVGVVGEIYEGPIVKSDRYKLTGGTRNFCNEPAMTVEEVDRCLQIGKETIIRVVQNESCKVVAFGEIGIGNTTTASTLIAALTNEPVESLCGGGAFASRIVDIDVIKKKVGIVKRALQKHKVSPKEPFSILSKVGGAEVAALVGAMIEASNRNIAVLVDGFIVTAAALVAVRMKPNVCNTLFFSTKSVEKGQETAIKAIQAIALEHNIPIPASPILSMNLRMGECTGALLSVPILKSSTAMVANMATIQDILS